MKTLTKPVLLWLDTEEASDRAESFSLYRETVLKGDVVSFQQNPAALIELLPELESLWSQWPSFAGVSLHGFESELQ